MTAIILATFQVNAQTADRKDNGAILVPTPSAQSTNVLESRKKSQWIADGLSSTASVKTTVDKKEITIVCRWTPIVRRPSNVIQRIKVWPLMQGQKAEDVIKSKPTVDEVCKTDGSHQIPLSIFCNPPTQPCPNGGGLVWQIVTVDTEGNVLGTSEASYIGHVTLLK